MDSGKKKMNSVAMTIINPGKGYWHSRGTQGLSSILGKNIGRAREQTRDLNLLANGRAIGLGPSSAKRGQNAFAKSWLVGCIGV